MPDDCKEVSLHLQQSLQLGPQPSLLPHCLHKPVGMITKRSTKIKCRTVRPRELGPGPGGSYGWAVAMLWCQPGDLGKVWQLAVVSEREVPGCNLRGRPGRCFVPALMHLGGPKQAIAANMRSQSASACRASWRGDPRTQLYLGRLGSHWLMQSGTGTGRLGAEHAVLTDGSDFSHIGRA